MTSEQDDFDFKRGYRAFNNGEMWQQEECREWKRGYQAAAEDYPEIFP